MKYPVDDLKLSCDPESSGTLLSQGRVVDIKWWGRLVLHMVHLRDVRCTFWGVGRNDLTQTGKSSKRTVVVDPTKETHTGVHSFTVVDRHDLFQWFTP